MKDHPVGRTFVSVRLRSIQEQKQSSGKLRGFWGNDMFYKIVVKGELSGRFAEAFAGMNMEAKRGQTIIMGQVLDQSHLYGILDRISGLGLQLLSVHALPEDALGGDDAAPLDNLRKKSEKETL